MILRNPGQGVCLTTSVTGEKKRKCFFVSISTLFVKFFLFLTIGMGASGSQNNDTPLPGKIKKKSPSPRSYEYVKLHGKRGIKMASGIKAADSLTLFFYYLFIYLSF